MNENVYHEGSNPKLKYFLTDIVTKWRICYYLKVIFVEDFFNMKKSRFQCDFNVKNGRKTRAHPWQEEEGFT